jgi:hypothetical protein
VMQKWPSPLTGASSLHWANFNLSGIQFTYSQDSSPLQQLPPPFFLGGGGLKMHCQSLIDGRSFLKKLFNFFEKKSLLSNFCNRFIFEPLSQTIPFDRSF